MCVTCGINNCCCGLTVLSGADGNGIVSVTSNGDGTLTILYTDGNTYVTPNFTGPTGPAGADGTNGLPENTGYTQKWIFNSTTTPTPSSTTMRFNTLSASTVTHIYFNYTNSSGTNVQDFLNSFKNPTGSQNKYGLLKTFLDMSPTNDINEYIVFDIISVTDTGTYIDLTVNYLNSTVTTTFSDTQTIGVNFTPSEDIYKTKLIQLTNWNMDSSLSKSVAHGLPDITKIVDIQVMIQDDSNSFVNPLVSISSGAIQGGINIIDSTLIGMEIVSGGIFDASDYAGTGDRGWITIKYLK